VLHALLLAALLLFAPAGSAAADAGAPLPPQPADVPWPTERWPTADLAPDVDAPALEDALARAFASLGRDGVPNTRALVAVHRGRLVVERYAEGFDAESRFRSWSMAKGVTNAVIGRLVGDGALELDAPAPVPEWSRSGDPRAALTLRELLQMTSGLDNADGGGEAGSFVGDLLFGPLSANPSVAAARVQLIHPPGTFWAYSTGTSHILAGIAGRAIGGDAQRTRAWFDTELAGPIGARSLMFEYDASGVMMGGSFAWARALDWARLGYLYLRDGVWDGERVLPEGWVAFSRTPAPVANNGTFGAHLWINADPAPEQFRPLAEGLDAFQMSGNAGQYVVMLPRRDLVIVRLGEMQGIDWGWLGGVVSDVAKAFPVTGAAAPADAKGAKTP
jgi:CubicO group peptidase (beta-lactamase class C family)